MQEASEYLELSLSGKWGAIARKWLEKNAPCSVEDYLVGVSRFMPTHIVHDKNGRVSQIGLARAALKRMKPVVCNGLVYPPNKKNLSQKGYAERLRQDALKNGYVIKADYPDIKNFTGIVQGLVKQGLLVYQSKNRYILNGSIEQEKQ
jgi:hypothetical protein